MVLSEHGQAVLIDVNSVNRERNARLENSSGLAYAFIKTTTLDIDAR